MNEQFIDSLKVKTSAKLREEIINILKGNKTIIQVCREYEDDNEFPKDPKTIRARIEYLAGNDKEINGLYIKYKERSKRERGYSYIAEVIDMLEMDYSQRAISEKYGISRNTLKDAIKRLSGQEDFSKLLSAHTNRHKHGKYVRERTEEEKEKLKREISELKIRYKVDLELEANRNIVEQNFNTVKDITERVLELEKFGSSAKDISEELQMGQSTIRAYKSRYKRLVEINKMSNNNKESSKD